MCHGVFGSKGMFCMIIPTRFQHKSSFTNVRSSPSYFRILNLVFIQVSLFYSNIRKNKEVALNAFSHPFLTLSPIFYHAVAVSVTHCVAHSP